jgi:hypothetical protein
MPKVAGIRAKNYFINKFSWIKNSKACKWFQMEGASPSGDALKFKKINPQPAIGL